jgi:uncharacterized protein (TIGR02145 family)
MKKKFLMALQLLSCFVLQAQIGVGTPNPDPSSVLELKSSTRGFLPPRMTTIQRNNILSPAIGLMIYNTDKNCLEWCSGAGWYNGCDNQESSGGTSVVSSYSKTNTSTGTLRVGTLVTGVTQTITAIVTVAGSYNISAIANGITFKATGIFTTTGMQDIVFTATGTPSLVETSDFILNTTPNCSFSRAITKATVSAVCDGSVPTVVVPITSATGKVWMDRNLGASASGTSSKDYQSYGCLYQWGRGNDGHADISWDSAVSGVALYGTTGILATSDSPGNSLLIIDSEDWRSSKNDALWQGISGINNPCPLGYRVPTEAEFMAEVDAYGITNTATGYASPHKFVSAGARDKYNGDLYSSASNSYYWTSTVVDSSAFVIYFNSSLIARMGIGRSNAYSVRCIKD